MNSLYQNFICVCCLLWVMVVVPPADSLSVTTGTATSNRAPPIRKVAIIGSGIAGLTLAHCLASPGLLPKGKTEDEGSIEFSLYDARPGFDFNAGAGIQLNGGMSILKKINPSMHRAVADAALPLKFIRSQARPWNANDDVQNSDVTTANQLFELQIEESILKEGGIVEDSLIVDGEVMVCTIMRGALQEALWNELPKDKRKLEFGKRLVGIEGATDQNEGIFCYFQDGSIAGPFDLVVGSDGIKSAVKEFVDTGKITKPDVSNDKRHVGSSIYSGIRLRYAVADPSDELPRSTGGEIQQWFGKGGWALTALYGAGAKQSPVQAACIIEPDPDYLGPFKRKTVVDAQPVSQDENVEWKQERRTGANLNAVMRQSIQSAGIPSSEVKPIVDKATKFFEQGVYFHNPFRLSGWSKEVKGSGGRYCVLNGDAAHAMPPFLGQGANQAIQTAYCLATKIVEHNHLHTVTPVVVDSPTGDGEEDAIEKPNDLPDLLKEYERIRWMPTTSLSVKAFLLGYVEIGEGTFLSRFRDILFSTLGKLGIARKIFLDAATPKVT